MRLEPGETVLLRHGQRGQLGGVFPFRAVRHDAEGILLWAPAGTRGWLLDMPDGRGLGDTPLAAWAATRRVPVARRVHHDALSWHPTDRDHSIRWFFSDGRFTRWYANLEAPAVPWRAAGLAGLDTVDWDLDVVIRPDRTWAWKDEDVFAARLRDPDHYWVDDEQRVRKAGREVIDLVEAGVFPFDGTWCDFRPDPAWPSLPGDLPPGWDRPHHYA